MSAPCYVYAWYGDESYTPKDYWKIIHNTLKTFHGDQFKSTR